MPAVRQETLLQRFRKRRGVTLARLGEILRVSTSQAAKYCLPLKHKHHSNMGAAPAARLRKWSGGRVHGGNFADPVKVKPRRNSPSAKTRGETR